MPPDNIPPEKQSAWERWEMASFDAPRAAPPPTPEVVVSEAPGMKLPTAEELEHIQQQASEEGHQEGYQAGFAEGQAAARAAAEQLEALVERMEQAITGLDEQVASELLELSLEVARLVLRQTIAHTPESILPVIREAITLLPHQHAAIYLNPEDASLARSYLGDQLTHAGHRIHESPLLARGDCRIEAGNTQVDATVATRWQRVVSDLGSSEEWIPQNADEAQ